ncbi:hypothetical protein FNH22_26885 [Fulvivirga sp. M361]|uniref:hypothetical protein n=1 Tax=Fulvivirga sp. M361 TaxID=2594266 RepID=UPI00117AB1AC|nr:hypothetical protein [Fulvivirga sp. M361]TRX49695.1 hypothetical protein FNH22_26885 [Fulvivirga sp. M361]
MNNRHITKYVLASMLCCMAGLLYAQSPAYNIELEDKSIFSEQKDLEGELIPNTITLVPRPGSGYNADNMDATRLSEIFNNEFEIRKYKRNKNKLEITTTDNELGQIKYVFDLENNTGKLKWEGGSLKFDTWGSWTCTNHSPNNHTCGQNESRTLKQCSQDLHCIF